MIRAIGEHNRLNAEEVAARRASRFEKLDAAGSGVLTTDEIDELVNKIDETTGISLDLDTFATTLDRDGNGEINLEEFGNLREIVGGPHPSKLPWGVQA